jgi:hypothetical protein
MAKLNRLPWAAGMSFEAYGVRIGVRVTEPSVLDDVIGLLPTGWKPRRNPRVDHLVSLVVGDRERRGTIRRLHLLYAGSFRAFRTAELDEALRFLEYHFEEYVAQMAPRRIFVHAGVAAWRGKAILIPGRSHSGKTSLVTALLHAGATYYSDEYAVLDDRGYVHPYPRPLCIRDTSEIGRRVRAEEIGARLGRRPIPVAMVVATRYEERARWRPRPLSRGEAVLELFSNTVPARLRPHQALDVLRQVTTKAVSYRSPRGEARETAQRLLEVVG